MKDKDFHTGLLRMTVKYLFWALGIINIPFIFIGLSVNDYHFFIALGLIDLIIIIAILLTYATDRIVERVKKYINNR